MRIAASKVPRTADAASDTTVSISVVATPFSITGAKKYWAMISQWMVPLPTTMPAMPSTTAMASTATAVEKIRAPGLRWMRGPGPVVREDSMSVVVVT